jgi:prepilin-type N-terminal cleavage/methylation domain-containing protein
VYSGIKQLLCVKVLFMKKSVQKLRAYFSTLPGFSSTAGFTLIELLIVISIVGILSVAVLSSLNPIEQINKGRDTRLRADAAQLINSADRYFAVQEVYPWNTTTATYTTLDADYSTEFILLPGGDLNFADVLVSTAEVKEGFVNRLKNDDRLTLFKPAGTNTTMYSCFVPTSQAFKLQAVTNCDDGSTPGGTGSPVTPPVSIVPCVSAPADITEDNMLCLP